MGGRLPSGSGFSTSLFSALRKKRSGKRRRRFPLLGFGPWTGHPNLCCDAGAHKVVGIGIIAMSIIPIIIA